MTEHLADWQAALLFAGRGQVGVAAGGVGVGGMTMVAVGVAGAIGEADGVLVGITVRVAVGPPMTPEASSSTCRLSPLLVQVGSSGPRVMASKPLMVKRIVSPATAPSSVAVAGSSP